MPSYQHKDTVKTGIPFGGIGAGKLEILPSGLFNAITFQNNWSKPISGNGEYPGILGYHMGLFVSDPSVKKGSRAFLLQTVPVAGLPTVRQLRLDGVFPKAVLHYLEPGLGLDVSLEVFSPWIPGDIKHTSLPCVFFKFVVKNKRKSPVDAAFLFTARNLCGEWCVGRRNRVEESSSSVDLVFSNEERSGRDPMNGSVRYRFEKTGWSLSAVESWNAVSKNFSFTSENILLPVWEEFSKKGALDARPSQGVVHGENRELCGAVAAKQRIPAGGTKELLFTASWSFPDHPDGHQYEKWFKGTQEVSRYASLRRNALAKKTARVEELVFSLPFPEWFRDALLTNLAPFFSSSWYVKDGRFAFYEAPIVCPLMGTLDVGYYGSIPLGYFFPELERSQILQFAKAQRPDGYVPHDLGKNRIDLASNGTTFYRWKDLNSKFILVAYRDYLWSGADRAFLKQVYPNVRKALDWILKTDADGNGLPDNEGADQTFDLWEFYGTSPYTSNLFLAALLACEKMGQILGDRPFAERAAKLFKRGRMSFEKELWNGQYFGEACTLSQLNGQWYADLLGLGDTVDPRKIHDAIRVIWRKNRGHSRYGMINSVTPDGSVDESNEHSRNVWSGMNYAYLCLALSRGLPLNNLLKEAQKLWHNVTHVQKSPWNQPDTIDAKTGRFVFGDSYYRNMAIWSIPIAYAQKDRKTAAVLKALKGLS